MSDTETIPRVWFITGCSSGLGFSLAHALLENGSRVIATARCVETIEGFAARFPETCRIFPLDVSDAAQVRQVVADSVAAFGVLDVVVNNAGFGLIGAFEEITEEEIEDIFDVNFRGALAVIRAVLPTLRAQGRGHLVNVSAAATIANYPGFSIYGATKLALEGVSESLAAELKPLGINVTIVQPGPFRTDFVERSLVHASTRIADYDRTSGKFARLLASMSGKQPGDPALAAKAMIEAVESPAPPLRLILGTYANGKAQRAAKEAEVERTAWERISLNTQFHSNP